MKRGMRKQIIETLQGNVIVGRLISPFVLQLSCAFGRTCGKRKLPVRSGEEENEAMQCVSTRNSCWRRRKRKDADLKK